MLGFASASASVNVYPNVGIIQSAGISSVNIPDLGRENSTQTSNYLPAWGAISTTFSSNSNAVTWFPLPDAIAISDMTKSNSSGQRFCRSVPEAYPQGRAPAKCVARLFSKQLPSPGTDRRLVVLALP